MFIVIEGTDGSGKKTQFDLLSKRLQSLGHDLAVFDFPRYGNPSAYFVEQYLHGRYGTADEVGPFRGAMFYAMDRYAAAAEIRQALNDGKLILSNRYIGSNMAHQGGKLRDAQKRKNYYDWCLKMELQGMKIPAPDLNIVLHVAAKKAMEEVNDRAATSKIEASKRDVVHESDLVHITNAEGAYLELCDIYPEIFNKIECMDGNKLISIPEVEQLVWAKVEPLLKQ